MCASSGSPPKAPLYQFRRPRYEADARISFSRSGLQKQRTKPLPRKTTRVRARTSCQCNRRIARQPSPADSPTRAGATGKNFCRRLRKPHRQALTRLLPEAKTPSETSSIVAARIHAFSCVSVSVCAWFSLRSSSAQGYRLWRTRSKRCRLLLLPSWNRPLLLTRHSLRFRRPLHTQHRLRILFRSHRAHRSPRRPRRRIPRRCISRRCIPRRWRYPRRVGLHP